MIRKFLDDRRGNVAMMFAFMTIGVVGIGALAVDMTRGLSLKSDLQDIADAAALSGAYVATTSPSERMDVVRKTIAAHMATMPDDVQFGEPIIEFDDTTQQVTVTIPSQQSGVFAGMLGSGSNEVNASSTTTFAIEDVNPVSLALVLDISGSMAWLSSDGTPKIDVLKSAINSLFGEIESAAPRRDILLQNVRSGMTAYNTDIVHTHLVPMNFGWDHVTLEASGLAADGGTNSSMALSIAHQMLNWDPDIHSSQRKFLILMTDGENNDLNDSVASVATCRQAKEDGMRVFSVAFEAADNGKAMLLQCASPDGADDRVYSPDEQEVDDDCSSEIDILNASDVSNSTCSSQKVTNYFDASNAVEFKAAFRKIGEEIGKLETRITN